jgi:hypothetical protein
MLTIKGDKITFEAYWKAPNGHSYLRIGLERNHPENLWNYLCRNGIKPSSIGIYYEDVFPEEMLLRNIKK